MLVSHRVRAEERLRVLHLEVPQLELVPLALEFIGLFAEARVRRDVHVFVVHFNGRNVNLDVATRQEVEVLALGELDDEFLDERRHVVVRNHFALPLLDAEDLVGHLDLHVVLDLHLATKAPVVSDLLAVEETRFGRKDFTSALEDLALAHATGSATAAGRGKEYFLASERAQKRAARLHFDDIAVDLKLDRT